MAKPQQAKLPLTTRRVNKGPKFAKEIDQLRFRALTAASTNLTVFGHVKCSLVEMDQRFTGVYRLHLQSPGGGRHIQTVQFLLQCIFIRTIQFALFFSSCTSDFTDFCKFHSEVFKCTSACSLFRIWTLSALQDWVSTSTLLLRIQKFKYGI